MQKYTLFKGFSQSCKSIKESKLKNTAMVNFKVMQLPRFFFVNQINFSHDESG